MIRAAVLAGRTASQCWNAVARFRSKERCMSHIEERLSELEQAETGIRDQITALERELSAIVAIIEQPELMPLAANG